MPVVISLFSLTHIYPLLPTKNLSHYDLLEEIIIYRIPVLSMNPFPSTSTCLNIAFTSLSPTLLGPNIFA